jgi:hypothetical protein
MDLPGHLYIAVGAVVASIIAGAFSYFNLVTAKETKVSEFRQEWINELRKEISLYVSSMQALVTLEEYLGVHLEDELRNMEIIKRRADLHDATLNAYNSIHLRINKNEDDEKAKKINDTFILSIEEAHLQRNAGEIDDLGYHLELVITNAEALLKHEWNRVRDGEKSYRRAKNSALTLLVLSTATLVFIGCLVVNHSLSPPKINKKLISSLPQVKESKVATKKEVITLNEMSHEDNSEQPKNQSTTH